MAEACRSRSPARSPTGSPRSGWWELLSWCRSAGARTSDRCRRSRFTGPPMRLFRTRKGSRGSPFVVDLETVAREFAPAPDFAAIEQHVAGRLGVAALDTATGRRLAYRADERFALCSTFKWLLGAQVLARAEAGVEQLSRV